MTASEIIRPLLPAPSPKAASAPTRGGRPSATTAAATPATPTAGASQGAAARVVEAVFGVGARAPGQRSAPFEDPERVEERSSIGRRERTGGEILVILDDRPRPPRPATPFLAQFIDQEVLSDGLYISPLPAALAAYRGAAGRIDAQAAVAGNLDIAV